MPFRLSFALYVGRITAAIVSNMRCVSFCPVCRLSRSIVGCVFLGHIPCNKPILSQSESLRRRTMSPTVSALTSHTIISSSGVTHTRSHHAYGRTPAKARTSHTDSMARTYVWVTSFHFVIAVSVYRCYCCCCVAFTWAFRHRSNQPAAQQWYPFFIKPLIECCTACSCILFFFSLSSFFWLPRNLFVATLMKWHWQRQQPSSGSHLNIFQLILIGAE